MREGNLYHRNPLAEPPLAQFELLLVNPPFNGAFDKGQLDARLSGHKTELLFADLALQALKIGGRAALIVPTGLLFGRSKAHRLLRQALIEEHHLSTIIDLPKGVFKRKPPHWLKGRSTIGTGVAAHILIFSKGGQTGAVRFCELTDFSPAALAAILPGQPPPDGETPGCLCWTVTKEAIVANDYDLSPNRYRPWPEPEPPQPVNEVWGELKALEAEIARSSAELEKMLYELGYEPKLPGADELESARSALQTHLTELSQTFSNQTEEKPHEQP